MRNVGNSMPSMRSLLLVALVLAACIEDSSPQARALGASSGGSSGTSSGSSSGSSGGASSSSGGDLDGGQVDAAVDAGMEAGVGLRPTDLVFLAPDTLKRDVTNVPDRWENRGSIGKAAVPVYGNATVEMRGPHPCLRLPGDAVWALSGIVAKQDQAPYTLYAVVASLDAGPTTREDGSVVVALAPPAPTSFMHEYPGGALLVDTIDLATGLSSAKVSARMFGNLKPTFRFATETVSPVTRTRGPMVLALESRIDGGTPVFRLWIDDSATAPAAHNNLAFALLTAPAQLTLGRGHAHSNVASSLTGTICHVIYSQGVAEDPKPRIRELMQVYGIP